MPDITTTLNACELVWRQQSIATTTIADMRTELESHLREAGAAGKPIDTVIGSDMNAFARSWANAQPDRKLPTDTSTQDERSMAAAKARTRLAWSIAAVVVVTILGLVLGPRGSAEDLELWQWIFGGLTFVLLVGEMLSGGFFVLPFSIGSLSAAILAFTRVEPPVLLLVFLLVSALSLWGLREFAYKDDDVVVPVGANRYVAQHAVITEAINGVGTVGRVRIGTESWMAIADDNQHVPTGAVVTVSEVRGARLVVRPG